MRALFFLYAIHRFHIPNKPDLQRVGSVPFVGYQRLLSRRFDEAINAFLAAQKEHGPSDALSSALSTGYHQLGFQTLANQVRRSVRSVRGNQWMFRVGHPMDHPLRIRPALLRRRRPHAPFPILRERTPVRMDLSHSGWSDIFFLGMDYPEGARVLNISIDLGVRGRDAGPRPPVEVWLRVIDEPVLRLVSVDLGASADIDSLAEVFDFARDYLGLLKAAVIAAGIVPPGLEGSEQRLTDLLTRVVGPGLGLEVASCVNGIPKGSRLAVSTKLLASLISACMRATGQAHSLTGPLAEDDRRLVAARAILGEWLGGSGGGWQDSGGAWPGMKLIEGALAQEGDPEFGVSRGRLLPNHHTLDHDEAPESVRQHLHESLVLVHGGMAQNVGPILEMVTEKYLLRSDAEWKARQNALGIMDRILAAIRADDVRAIGAATTDNFSGPIQTIIPWAGNLYTETLIERMRKAYGADFWGFWMLGGMSGGGMGFMVAPRRKAEAQEFLQKTMSGAKAELEHSLPFAMDPVVYDFAINSKGTFSDLLEDEEALLSPGYYALRTPQYLRQEPRHLTPSRRDELAHFAVASRTRPEMAGIVETMFDRLFPTDREHDASSDNLAQLLAAHGFDSEQHEQIRSQLQRGLIGVAQNRLSSNTTIEDVRPGDVVNAIDGLDARYATIGRKALQSGEAAVMTLAAGAGSRWSQGAGVVKSLHPFCKLSGRHRTFLEVHLAKSRRTSRELPHVITTGYLTHEPIARHLRARESYGYPGPVLLSPGRAVGWRLIPMLRDLRFVWEEMPQQLLDEQAQKVRNSLRNALTEWARQAGEGSNYTDNVPLQCLHPVGHWYEVPNLLLNGVLRDLLVDRPNLRYVMLHNIDTLVLTSTRHYWAYTSTPGDVSLSR